MKTVFKYPLELKEVQEIEMPKKAEILCIQTQNNKPCIWALVEPNGIEETRIFEIHGTADEIKELGYPKWRCYIGTFQLNGGTLVFHCFERNLKSRTISGI
jgi:hypothetical protein